MRIAYAALLLAVLVSGFRDVSKLTFLGSRRPPLGSLSRHMKRRPILSCRYFRGFRYPLSIAMRGSSTDANSPPKLDFDEDLYNVLEVEPDIDMQSLKKAYYKIVFKYHPDNKRSAEEKALCNRQMMVINAAYKVLRSKDKRDEYDRRRRTHSTVAGNSSSNKSSDARRTTSTPPQSANANYNRDSYDPSDYYRVDDRMDEQETDSLADIISDIWRDIQGGGTDNLLRDFNDFLDQQVRLKCYISL